MICYFCLTAPDHRNEVYTNLFKVSLESALSNTTLDIKILYDGPQSHTIIDILNRNKSLYPNRISIIPHEFSRKKYLPLAYPDNYLRKRKISSSYDKISGTFMRLDVPFIETQDDFVLYSDIDVYFNDNILLNNLSKPEYLSAAPEFQKTFKDMPYFNAGILLLNTRNMREKCKKIFLDLERGIPNEIGLFDQGFLNQYCLHEMDPLPLEYNWKPYWGINHQAKIIHYHGMKPGGDYSNSGFCMNEKTLKRLSNIYPDSICGLVYYTQLYFRKLGLPSEELFCKFVEDLVRANQKSSIENVEHISSKDLLHILSKYLKRKLSLTSLK